jgi:hypothetical protein
VVQEIDNKSAGNEETLTSSVGKFCLIPDSDTFKLSSARVFSYIRLLARQYETTFQGQSPILARYLRPITIEKLEILEAELQNQDIIAISKNSSSLSQHISHQANLWRWQARRSGIRNAELRFLVDLPRYILNEAKILISFLENEENYESLTHPLFTHPGNSWRINPNDKSQIAQKLKLLDNFASYITGQYEKTDDKYKKGLNSLLGFLTRRPNETIDSSPNKPLINLTLPLKREDFIEILQTFKSLGF